ncbi:MAG TPA: hypothetical protein VH597_09100 [Verrucomicrobiae bacterium]|jgi:hypothetical protein|nr:hypothetical protein [Verrucomicrobiae bacterium]
MLKPFPVIYALLVALTGVAPSFCHGAPGELPPKLKPIATCPALTTAAATNHIAMTRLDPFGATNTLRAGDSATILGTLFLKKSQAQWLLHIEAAALPASQNPVKKPPPLVVHLFDTPVTFESKPVPAKLRMLGPFPVGGGSKQIKPEDTRTRLWLNESFLGVGLDQAAAVISRRFHAGDTNSATASTNGYANVKLTTAEKRAISGAVPTLVSYFEIVQHTEGLEDLLLKLVKMPSLWSIIRHGGVDVSLHIDKEAFAGNPADWNLPANVPVYYLPCTFTLNGQAAVNITMVVTSPHPPLLICGGVIALLAERPGDNESYMTLRVISARRGPEYENQNELNNGGDK